MKNTEKMKSEIRTGDITTERLDKTLKNIKSENDAEKYIRKYTVGGYKNFAEYFNDYIIRHEYSISDIVNKSNVSRNYIYNIINDNRKPGRDKVIALCTGAGMNVKEIDRCLKLAGHNELYAKNERDARIIIAINQGIKNVIDLNIILDKAGVEELK